MMNEKAQHEGYASTELLYIDILQKSINTQFTDHQCNGNCQ